MKVRYIRKGSSIKDLENNSTKQYSSINLAKKASKELQLANGGLGRGILSMEFHKNQKGSVEAWKRKYK